ncbi:MAG TPA: SCO family protein [Gaiellaceae bacterium]|jgi:protein SCO1/2|nr:SCO family protein [Gaiellaceae bacterium]
MRRALLLLAVLVCAGCGAEQHTAAITHGPSPSARASEGFPVTPPVPAPSFLLRDQLGRSTGPQQDRGHWTVVTFLYTNCPDVCPLVASQLGAAQRANRDLRVIAVSVDPKNDTAAARRAFVKRHNLPARFRFVSGTRAALRPVWAGYHVAALPGPNGTVSHSTFEILVDPSGKERELFDAKVTARSVLRAVQALS